MAAGFGTRLRPSTQYCPKPLIPVGGVEPLFHALYQMKESGVSDVVVNAHYLHEQIATALKSWEKLFPTMKLHLSVENPEILGTGGSIHKVIRDFPKLFEDRGLLVMNGDTLAAFDLSPLLSRPEETCFAISNWKEHLKKYKPLWVDSSGAWVGIGSTAPAEGAQAAHLLGIHYIAPAHVELVKTFIPPQVKEADLFNGIYRPLVDRGVRPQQREIMKDTLESPYSEKIFWFDMTNIEYLLEAQRFVMRHLSRDSWWPRVLRARYPKIKELSPGVWVNASRQTKCRFNGPAIFIENSKHSESRSFSGLDIGPDASLVFDGGTVDFEKSGGSALVIRNSVVLVSRLDLEDDIPECIENDVRVI